MDPLHRAAAPRPPPRQTAALARLDGEGDSISAASLPPVLDPVCLLRLPVFDLACRRLPVLCPAPRPPNAGGRRRHVDPRWRLPPCSSRRRRVRCQPPLSSIQGRQRDPLRGGGKGDGCPLFVQPGPTRLPPLRSGAVGWAGTLAWPELEAMNIQKPKNEQKLTAGASVLCFSVGVGYRWMSQLIALIVYAILFMPGFIKVGYYYFFSRQVCRSVVYGDQPRNRLDRYMPRKHSKSSPVVAFVTGGAWIIGYKAWGALLGRRLAENFPQGTISDMVAYASEGISFVCNNAASYGGDPNQIYLMGQSAGAHIAACALMEQANKESRGEQISWNVAQIKAYFGLSGGYNIENLVNHFHERGLYCSVFLSIMEGEESLPHFSPETVAKKSSAEAIALLPQIVLLHGTEDHSIPSSASETFADVFKQAGGKVKLQSYEGKTHTDVFVQDPLMGGKDQLVDNVVSVIHADDAIAREKDASTPIPKRLIYEWQIKLARQISPF